MQRIFKYELKVTGEQVIRTFKGYRPLSVQFQRDVLCLWMLIDDNSPECNVEVCIFGTGHPCENNGLTYVGTAQTVDGYLVWHVFVEDSK